MALIVCSLENSECMLHRCNQCPGIEALKNFLVQEFMDHELEEDIAFKQWQSADCATLLLQSLQWFSTPKIWVLLLGLTTTPQAIPSQGSH